MTWPGSRPGSTPRAAARSRSERRRRRRSSTGGLGVGHREDRRSSRRRRRRGCRSRGPPCPRGRACAGARADRRRREARAGPRPRRPRPGPRRRPPGSAELGDLAVADDDVVDAVDPGARIEDRRARRIRSAGLAGAAAQRLGDRWSPRRSRRLLRSRRIGHRLAVGRAAGRSRAGEQLVEDRHPHDQPALDLIGDQRLRAESITSAESSTPRLTGPGCISSWRGPRRRRVDLVAGRVLAQRGDEGSRPSARSACAARRRRRPRSIPSRS